MGLLGQGMRELSSGRVDTTILPAGWAFMLGGEEPSSWRVRRHDKQPTLLARLGRVRRPKPSLNDQLEFDLERPTVPNKLGYLVERLKTR